MSKIVASNWPFAEVCKFLHSHATQQEYTATENQMRNIMRTQQTQPVSPITASGEDQTEPKDVWICWLLNIPEELWDKLDNDTKKWFIAKRRKVKNKRPAHPNQKESTRPRNGGRPAASRMPQQYATAQQSWQEEQVDITHQEDVGYNKE